MAKQFILSTEMRGFPMSLPIENKLLLQLSIVPIAAKDLVTKTIPESKYAGKIHIFTHENAVIGIPTAAIDDKNNLRLCKIIPRKDSYECMFHDKKLSQSVTFTVPREMGTVQPMKNAYAGREM